MTMADRNESDEERLALASVIKLDVVPRAAADAPYVPSFIDWQSVNDSGKPPPRAWAMEQWLGMGYTTLLAAKGGMGKSIFAQQLATALALGLPFVADILEPRTVLAWMGEDDDDELARRQYDICRKFNHPVDALRDKVFMESMLSTDCCLVARVAGVGLVRTGMLKQLREQIGDNQTGVVVLDNVAKLFNGSENDRGDVTAFITAIAWAAEPTSAAVLLISHIAKMLGSEYSGSTAWENACRARWWLTDVHPEKTIDKDKDTDGEPVTDLRFLSKRKVNYTSRDIAVLCYDDGAYDVVTPAAGGLIASIDRGKAKRVIIACIPRFHAMGIVPTESSASPNFLPKLITTHLMGEGISRQDLTQAMRILMTEGLIKRGKIGEYPNRTSKFGLVINPLSTDPNE